MKWRLEWGPHLKALRARAKQTGVLPAPLSRIPKLKRWDPLYLKAFDTLNACRTAGMSGPNPLSMGDIAAYLALVEVDSVPERVKYVSLIQEMDGVLLSYWAEKSQNNKNK